MHSPRCASYLSHVSVCHHDKQNEPIEKAQTRGYTDGIFAPQTPILCLIPRAGLSSLIHQVEVNY